jgi:hypothetical protein
VGDHTKSAKLLGFFRQGTLVETIFTLQRFCSLRFLGGRGGGGCGRGQGWQFGLACWVWVDPFGHQPFNPNTICLVK